jgi:hypothetical protein
MTEITAGYVNPRYPTRHESTNGWNGANNDTDMPCEVCGRGDVERVIYHGGNYGPESDGHIVVCFPCSQTLGPEWHGCGCGG